MFDELDHLGAYIQKNRSDLFYAEQLAEGVDWLAHADACAPIDDYFADPDWPNKEPPRQVVPALLQEFLMANNSTRGPRFLEADAAVRDMGFEGREDMDRQIGVLLPTLQEHPYRWFVLVGTEPLMVWLQRAKYVDMVEVHKAKAEAVALAAQASRCKVLMAYIKQDGTFAGGWAKHIPAPQETDSQYAVRLADARRVGSRSIALTPEGLQRRGRRAAF